MIFDSVLNMSTVSMNKYYFSETTLCHLRMQHGLSARHRQRSLDVTLACKLTLAYGKYHLMMLHRQLAMSEERTSFQQAEKTADMMNKMTVFHSSPTDFLHTQEQSADESIDVYVYADALLWFQQGKIEYNEFCMQFQELSWMDGHRTPLDGKRLKMYIMSMREVVDWYKQFKNSNI